MSALPPNKPNRDVQAATGANDAGVPSPETPPMTNRGCLTPNTSENPTNNRPVEFHIDYLRLTLFVTREFAQSIVETELLERAGFPVYWLENGPVKFLANIYESFGPVFLLVPKTFKTEYTIIEIKGQGCTLLGSEVLQGFLNAIVKSGERWNGGRIDLAFDHVAFTPSEVDQAIRRGDIRSRCLGVEDRDWNDSATGQTAYLGGRKCKKVRRLRVYNARGFTRCEAEFHDEWAKSAMIVFADSPMASWPEAATAMLRGMVDFVDSKANARIERCPLLPWWSEFVGAAGKIKNLSDEARSTQEQELAATAIAESERALMRCARSLWPIMEAFGKQYLIERLQYHAEGRIEADDHQFAEELKRWRYSGYAGLPTERPSEEGDDVPF